MGVICATGLVRRYGRRVGIDGVDLDVPAGALYGFLGPNGAGKTTFIRLMLGFPKPNRELSRELNRLPIAWSRV